MDIIKIRRRSKKKKLWELGEKKFQFLFGLFVLHVHVVVPGTGVHVVHLVALLCTCTWYLEGCMYVACMTYHVCI